MDTTVRATCPKCRMVLKIPVQWVGQTVKCKKCGTMVRSRPRSEGPAGPQLNGGPPPAGNAFDFSTPSPQPAWPLPEPGAPPAAQPEPFGPAGGIDPTAPLPAQPVPGAPGYPYPVPPGQPAPPGYAIPPGYPYAPPAGYAYPVPPGYAAPGYVYPVPPGHPVEGGYGAPPGYPYAVPPADPNAGFPAAGNGAYSYPAPYAVPPHNGSASAPANPASHTAEAGSTAFHADAPVVSPRRYRRGNNASKWIWVALCLFLTAGLIAGGIFAAKRLKDNGPGLNSDPIAKVVEKLGSTDAAARDDAFARLKAKGREAEAALKEGARSENPAVAKSSGELLALLNGAPPPVAKIGQFPRRMLFISISKYMYLNPLTYAEVINGNIGEDKTRPAALRLAYEWQVPNDPRSPDNNQLFVLSDSAKPDNPKATIPLPMKNVVVGAYDRFFESSRDQDRIVVYFGGHALEKGGKAYIAPIEGDPDEPNESLIPLADFYEKMKACKATQKIVIWDVCRFNPQRGRQRPGSEPMTASLHKALLTAPEGVEVVITCKPGENALEFFYHQVEAGATASTERIAGSSFLEAMRYVVSKSARNPGKQPTPADPIPMKDWSSGIARRLVQTAQSSASLAEMSEDMSKDEKQRGFTQTLTVAGKMRDSQVAYNPEIPPAKRFELPTPPRGVPAAEIAAIVNEFSVPPIRPGDASSGIIDIAFREDVMKDFKADVSIDEIMADKEKYRFRAVTIAALDKIRKMWATAPGATGGPPLRESFDAPVDGKLKNTIKSEQEFWAFGIAELELLNTDLDAVKAMKEGEPKRWQANYEYACAVLKARLAYMNEYNKLMGDVLTETLPQLDLKLKQDGYKLVSSEKMKSKGDVKKLADEAREAYQTLITKFKGTPWAIQAKRDKSFSLGLVWQPNISGKAELNAP